MALTAALTNPNATLASGGLEGITDDVITAVYWNRAMSDLFFLLGTAGYIGSRAYNNANISVANGAIVTVLLNSGRWESDPNGTIHSTVTLTSRLTCRTPGVYNMGASIEWAASAVGVRVMYLLKNNSEIIGYNVMMPLTNGDPHRMAVATVDILVATDYIELLVYQTSGGALNLVSAAAYSPHLWMLKA